MLSSVGPTRRAAIYVRISRDKTGAKLGVERQTVECVELAARLGLTVVTTYSDNDLSAYSGKPRPDYRRLLADVRAGRVDVVLAWHTDRLHRSPAELEEWIIAAERHGVAVQTVKAGEIDLATASGQAIARTLGAWARFESQHRAERVAAKMDEIARNGGFMGGVRPFGYRDGGLELHPEESAAVADGIAMILNGRSLRAVTLAWRRAGLRTTKAKREWTPDAVRDVLVRWRNCAKLEHRGQVVGDAAWPAIVDEAQLRGARAILLNPARRTSPGNSPRWLLSGLARCAGCGGPLVVGTSGQHRHPSYVCRARREGGGPRHVSRAAPALDAYLTEVVLRRLEMPDAADLFAPPPVDIDTAAVRAELERIAADRDELAARFGRGEITLTMLDAADSGLRGRQEAADAALAMSAVSAGPVAALAGSGDVRGRWAGLALETRRAVVAELVTVTVLPAPRGRRSSGGYFEPAAVQIEWKRAVRRPV